MIAVAGLLFLACSDADSPLSLEPGVHLVGIWPEAPEGTWREFNRFVSFRLSTPFFAFPGDDPAYLQRLLSFTINHTEYLGRPELNVGTDGAVVDLVDPAAGSHKVRAAFVDNHGRQFQIRWSFTALDQPGLEYRPLDELAADFDHVVPEPDAFGPWEALGPEIRAVLRDGFGQILTFDLDGIDLKPQLECGSAIPEHTGVCRATVENPGRGLHRAQAAYLPPGRNDVIRRVFWTFTVT